MGLEYRNTDVYQIRYELEHRFLPQGFFRRPEDIVNFLMTTELGGRDVNPLFDCVDTLFEKVNGENPYLSQQFKVEGSKFIEGIYLIKITYPTPEYEPLCYNAFLFFKEGFKDQAFLCLERGGPESNNKPYLCAWFADGERRNYGAVENDGEVVLKKCCELYLELYRTGDEDKNKGEGVARVVNTREAVEDVLRVSELYAVKMFLSDTKSFIEEFTVDGSFYDLITGTLRSGFYHDEIRFGENDFDLVKTKISDALYMVKFIFPKPMYDKQMSCVYCFFDPHYKKLACYGVVFQKDLEYGNFYLVEFDPEGNYTLLSSDPVEPKSFLEDEGASQMRLALTYCEKFGTGL